MHEHFVVYEMSSFIT